MIGKTLAHYQIIELIGVGGMGEVYRARDTKLDRDIALKVLPADLATDPARLERFQREAKIVAGLNHPYVVTLFSVEEDAGVHFLTMELVEGQSLKEALTIVGLPLAQVLDIGIAVADALAAAHNGGGGAPRSQSGQRAAHTRGAREGARFWTREAQPEIRLIGAVVHAG